MSSSAGKRKTRSQTNSEQAAEAANKRKKKKSPADDLVCPISWELPWDPVTAEDGRVYDRPSIETHFNNHAGGELKSPMTNEKIGTRLFPAVQHRNTIETLLEAGIIQGDLADKWNKKVEEKKEADDLLKEAEGGDADAMLDIASKYGDGADGFKKDDKLAFHWYKRAYQAGSVSGTACLGLAHCFGQGVDKCFKKGMMYISLAAGQGSGIGAYILGMALAKGKHGMPVDKEEAVRWLEKCLSNCAYDDLSERGKLAAQQKLDKLKASHE